MFPHSAKVFFKESSSVLKAKFAIKIENCSPLLGFDVPATETLISPPPRVSPFCSNPFTHDSLSSN